MDRPLAVEMPLPVEEPWRRSLWATARSLSADILPPLVALTAAFLLWEGLMRVLDVPVYLVPRPSQVFARLWQEPGYFGRAALTTLYEALAGFALGASVALVGAIIMAHSRLLEKSLFPLAILVKVTPIVAVAPLFTIWFGFGLMPKVFIAALITFFPVLVNAITGFRSVNATVMEFLLSLNAAPWEIFLKLRLPSALPFLFAAFKVSITLSVIGAVVAEWTGASQGLGRIIWLSHVDLNMPTLFAAIIVLAAMGVSLYFILAVIERRVLFWHESISW